MPITADPFAARAEHLNLTPQEVARYSRHLIMPEVGMEGQKRLKAASVLLVGAGGSGPGAELSRGRGLGHSTGGDRLHSGDRRREIDSGERLDLDRPAAALRCPEHEVPGIQSPPQSQVPDVRR